jgi:cytochrome bd ubiquinol oxidase subunit II
VTYEVLILAIIWMGLTLYALLAGADFGGGVWSAFASGATKERQRALVASAIAPVWEANHVWLIFVVTALFASFPIAFEALGVALYVPFSIALAGIVLRGAAFAFRSHGDPDSRWQHTWTQVFGIASLVSPLALGAAAGAIAAGRIRIHGGEVDAGVVASWAAWLPAVTAVLALAVCAYLAATYLTIEATASGDRRAAEAFRGRALISGVAAGVCAAAGLIVARSEARVLWHGMLHRGLPFVVLSGIGGVTALAATAARRYQLARTASAAAVAAVLAGWGAAQWPLLIVPDLTVKDAAAPEATLHAVFTGLLIGGMLLVPSLMLLFRVFKSPTEIGRTPELAGEPER